MAKINTSRWKELKIGELLPKIRKPHVLRNRQVTKNEQGIPYIVRTKFDSGIKCRVQLNDDMAPNPVGFISFGAESATSFYQQEEFVSGRDICYIDTRKLRARACMMLLSVCL